MTTTATKATKQTAGNNPFLADVKHLFNRPLFLHAVEMVNTHEDGPAAGETAFRFYLLENVTRNADHVCDLGTGRRYY